MTIMTCERSVSGRGRRRHCRFGMALALLVPVLLLAACGAPADRLGRAETTLAEIRHDGTASYAPELLRHAEDLLVLIQAEVAEQRARRWYQRDPRRVWRLLDDVETSTRRIRQESMNGAVAARTAARDELARARWAVIEARSALELMPARRDTHDDVGEMRVDLKVLEDELAAAWSALEAGDFAAALDAARSVAARARRMASTVERARAHLLILPEIDDALGRIARAPIAPPPPATPPAAEAAPRGRRAAPAASSRAAPPEPRN